MRMRTNGIFYRAIITHIYSFREDQHAFLKSSKRMDYANDVCNLENPILSFPSRCTFE